MLLCGFVRYWLEVSPVDQQVYVLRRFDDQHNRHQPKVMQLKFV